MRRVGWLVIGLSGCGWELTSSDGLAWLTATRQVGPDGRIPVVIEVPENATSVQVVADLGGAAKGYVESLTDAAGDVPFVAKDTWDGVHHRTNAGFSAGVVVMDWPIAESDGPLLPGTLRFDVRVDDPSLRVPLTVALKEDTDLGAGVLEIDLVYAGALEDRPGVVAATDVAVARWREVYAAMDIELVVTEREWDGDATLGSPGRGDRATYLDATASKPRRAVTVLLVDRVTDAAGIFGVSGGIPGSLVPTDSSVVSVSPIEHAGSDGKFSDSDVRLLGETMAHEVGHYLGLFHPAELPVGGVVRSWDALDDTEECLTGSECDARLGTNLMYPTPLCTDASCTPQEDLTAQQQGVAHRYVGVE